MLNSLIEICTESPLFENLKPDNAMSFGLIRASEGQTKIREKFTRDMKRWKSC